MTPIHYPANKPDLQTFFSQIDTLSLFELHQLQRAIAQALDNPEKILAIKRHLKIGMIIQYFAAEKHQFVDAVVLSIKKTRVEVKNKDDHKIWLIHFCYINLQGADVTIRPRHPTGTLDKYTLKIGDRVGWHSKLGCDLFGIVKKLNPKKALVQLNSNELWTVGYSLLFLVMDGVSGDTQSLCIEGEVIR